MTAALDTDAIVCLRVGYGLSYTQWSYSVVSAPETVDLNPLQQLLDRTKLETGTHFPKLESVPLAGQYVVNVTNTGDRDAADVVLGFISPPCAGTQGLPIQSLFAFERVFVKAGQSTTVNLYPALTEMAFANLEGERAAIAGEYTVRFGVAETAEHGMGYVESNLIARF